MMRSVGLLLCLLASPLAAADRPNILLIVADDMGYGDAGFHGCRDIPTPHLDALAASGIRCTDGYVSGPYCSPTRAGLLAGRYQTRFGHEFNPSGPHGLPATETILPERLRAAGYATGLIGKWHLGKSPGQLPLDRGFGEFFGFLEGSHGYAEPAGIFRGREPVTQIDYTTDAFGREAVASVRRQQGRPWFLCLAFNAVHTPLEATPERLRRFSAIADERRRTYAAMLSALDDNVGRVLEALRETGQEKNTLVMFLSDNGGPTLPGTTVNGASNAPFRGSKRTTLEGGIRVPFVVSWPARLEPGVFRQPVIQLDLHATMLAAAGVAAAADWKLEGVDLLPYFNGENKRPPHDSLFWRFGDQMAIRRGDWKLVRYDAAADVDGGPGGTSPKPATPARLYDLSADRHEDHDLAAAMPETVRDLQAAWDAWDATNVAPLWGQGGKRHR